MRSSSIVRGDAEAVDARRRSLARRLLTSSRGAGFSSSADTDARATSPVRPTAHPRARDERRRERPLAEQLGSVDAHARTPRLCEEVVTVDGILVGARASRHRGAGRGETRAGRARSTRGARRRRPRRATTTRRRRRHGWARLGKSDRPTVVPLDSGFVVDDEDATRESTRDRERTIDDVLFVLARRMNRRRSRDCYRNKSARTF